MTLSGGLEKAGIPSRTKHVCKGSGQERDRHVHKIKKDQDSQRVGTEEVGRMVESGEKSAGARSCRTL